MRAVIDENVSLSVARALRARGWVVEHVAETAERAISDDDVWQKARTADALIVTRDHHLTNPIRFPPSHVAGVLFLRHGNLSAAQEAKLVVDFLSRHDPATLRGRLVTLSPAHLSIR
jgi:predicted nuclease of predicted toxin-antitoxin system